MADPRTAPDAAHPRGRRRRATGVALLTVLPAACAAAGGVAHDGATLLGSGLIGLAGLTLVSERWRRAKSAGIAAKAVADAPIAALPHAE